MEFLGALVVLFASLFATLARDSLTAGLAGLSVSYSQQVCYESWHIHSHLPPLYISFVLWLSNKCPTCKMTTDYYQFKCLHKDIIRIGKLRCFSGENRWVHPCAPRGKHAKWWNVKWFQIIISLKAFIGTASDLENYVVSVELSRHLHWVSLALLCLIFSTKYCS